MKIIIQFLQKFWHKSGLILPLVTYEVILNFMKNLCLHNSDILQKFWKGLALKKITYKDNFEILRWPLMTFGVILHLIKKKQGRKCPLDTPKKMIERRRNKGRRWDILREREIRERQRGERDREVKGIEVN